ncbi:mechanosensitive ion channel protein MscS [Paenibacillus oryzae]|uniref:Mechanosensitive ion channel protein MscS n=1 Tax=Paenibacillus oryzae TaxID=1844972 RepID=A0A1A5YM15_9BACL|nr:mechanosensitive ion channel family protein [Paenibacillus oryzae]OBR66669.1 mechanosensitive ion channel protein MscS [Paenibacillus oryzae]
MGKMYNSFVEWLNKNWEWELIGLSAIRIAAILVIGRLVIWLLHKTINRIVLDNVGKRTLSQARRMTTVGKLLKNVTTYIIYFITFMLLLSEFGVNLGPLLAGAGVVGLAIGFGAQSLVKDILTGFFIILEDQFAVGDVIQTGKFKGTVEVIGLRTTRIVSWTGEVHILPNSMIQDVTNFSIHNSLAVVDVAVPFATDVNSAMEWIQVTVNSLHHENIIQPPKVLGVQSITAADMVIRVIAECRPNSQSAVSRLLYKEIQEMLLSKSVSSSIKNEIQEG